MTKQLSAININTDTFDTLFTRLNEIISAANTELVTANTNANGSVSVGNTYLNGILFATTLCTNGLRGGNVQTSATLSITSNVSVNASSNFLLGNSTVNVVINSSTVSISGRQLLPLQGQVNVQTSGTSAQLLDSFLKSDWRGADYLVTITDNAANNFQMMRALVVHDSGLDAYMTEYGLIYSNSQLGILSSNANTTHLRLYITPTSTNTQIKATRTVVAL